MYRGFLCEMAALVGWAVTVQLLLVGVVALMSAASLGVQLVAVATALALLTAGFSGFVQRLVSLCTG